MGLRLCVGSSQAETSDLAWPQDLSQILREVLEEESGRSQLALLLSDPGAEGPVAPLRGPRYCHVFSPEVLDRLACWGGHASGGPWQRPSPAGAAGVLTSALGIKG